MQIYAWTRTVYLGRLVDSREVGSGDSDWRECVAPRERERESARALRLSLAEKDCAPALACVWREDGYGYGCGCGCGSIICRDTTGGYIHDWACTIA